MAADGWYDVTAARRARGDFIVFEALYQLCRGNTIAIAVSTFQRSCHERGVNLLQAVQTLITLLGPNSLIE